MGKLKKVLRSCIYLVPFLLITVGCDSDNQTTISPNVSTSESQPSTKEALWNEEVDDILYKAVGSYYSEIPVYTAERYETLMFKQEDIDIAEIFCFTKDYESSENTYSIVLKLNGFSANQHEENGQTYSIASKRVSSYEVLCLQYEKEESEIKGGYLHILAYVLEDRLMSWPSEKIIADIGQDIPHCEAEYYQYATQNYGDLTLAMIACYGLEDPNVAIENYLSLLETNSYSYKTLESAYYCTNDETGIEIDFYYDTDYEYLLIQAYVMPGSREWPTQDLQDLFLVNIPEYHETGVRYFSGLVQDANKSLLYEIDCSNASPSSEETYKELLENNGWVRREEYDYESWGYIYIINEGEESECQIQFYYEVEGMTLIIQILIMNIE